MSALNDTAHMSAAHEATTAGSAHEVTTAGLLDDFAFGSGLWELLLRGVWITVQLTVYGAALGAAVAFAVGLARQHRLWAVRFVAGAYFEIFRGTSALVLMIWVFFVVPLTLGWQLVPMWAAVLTLGCTYGAYGSEIVRGAVAAVPAAQREAGVALSFTPAQRMRKIVLPQAWPEMVPPFCNLLIELLKGTALVSVLGVADTTFAAQLVRNATGQSAPVYTVILVMYFLLAFAITRVMRQVERRAKAGVGRAPAEGVPGPRAAVTGRPQDLAGAGAATGGAGAGAAAGGAGAASKTSAPGGAS
ncbi:MULTISPECIES: ectoine/hydroxyectoine ABC transporter permease subunit EhuC [Streptomyces]|uniref:Polar amino acid transport system permease protein n=1 Tax=Streptomyces stelliscabiei TaxID=146820 RepID=A0A8I0P4X0_9ACTN|nr:MULTISPECIES: ectoine/hydroxyectoine ABC transporter permease subunit EhuC [Streptomyces]KND40997.1 amino acid ABC transporter permease [Streptomyces stelliscabiei]MBE1597567.1 polar amino acid transport system permease protein [Streptomyces stelliscabiei]MDX2522181.1 ectoine/hydroxyectoine ABC transporter permease subunit EhuC [Streptomyces stelliscabiei]MDX2549785.1 ectoine/hydroxyectoine ABC transporter permease subunit EhuC [Streptomyces stelliscabiei]MDX2610794.1 ectoine/hydroxyectoine